MLSVILGILKLIGIILGILLLLVLAAVLAVVFVPVRYYVRGEKQEGRLSACVKVSWLLRIVSASLRIDGSGRPEISVRLFGIRLPLFGAARSGRGSRKKARVKGPQRKKEEPETAGSPYENDDHEAEAADDFAEDEEFRLEIDVGGAEKSGSLHEEDEFEAEAADDLAEENEKILLEVDVGGAEKSGSLHEEDEFEAEVADDLAEAEKSLLEVDVDASEDDGLPQKDDVPGVDSAGGCSPDAGGDTRGEPENADSSGFRFSFRAICDRIKKIYEKLKERWSALRARFRRLCERGKALAAVLASLPQWISRIAQRIASLLQKPGELLALAEKLEVKEVLGHVAGYAKELLKHYAPRRVSGFLRFDTGDPAVTAQLTGVLYLVLPARADRFSLEPEFGGEAAFETDISFRGHIRAVHLIRVAWKAFRDKKLRRMIRYARKRRQ